MNTKTIMAYTAEEFLYDKSMAPFFKEEPIIIFFETQNTSEILPNVISDYYNLGVNTWPTGSWINNQLNYFIEHGLKPINLYKPGQTIVWLRRLYSDREKTLNKNKYNGAVLEAIYLI